MGEATNPSRLVEECEQWAREMTRSASALHDSGAGNAAVGTQRVADLLADAATALAAREAEVERLKNGSGRPAMYDCDEDIQQRGSLSASSLRVLLAQAEAGTVVISKQTCHALVDGYMAAAAAELSATPEKR